MGIKFSALNTNRNHVLNLKVCQSVLIQILKLCFLCRCWSSISCNLGLDYKISKDLLIPSQLQGQRSLSLYLQYHTRRKKGVGFTWVTKINVVLLLGALRRRKAWSVALVLERWILPRRRVRKGRSRRMKERWCYKPLPDLLQRDWNFTTG